MTSMELQARKMSIIEELLQLNTMEALDKVAQVVRAMKREEKTDERVCRCPSDVMELMESIRQARSEAANGEGCTLQELKEKVKLW